MDKTMNLQENLLNQLRKDKTIVTVFLTNGFQLKGLVRGFDNFIVLVETDEKQQIIYKHAISTIIPASSIMLDPNRK
ncbi:MAG TPA: RNA chaperone Hfq [Epulopiscium sp.]|nr:RNA chaperone Hfq [Candidatus Epulonipiscium sp.]